MYGGGPSTGTNTLTTGMSMTLEGSGAGNVGIGTDSPRVTASVIGLTIGNSTIGGSELVLRENTGNDWRIFNNGYLGFIDDNTERMRIDASGNLLVSDTTANPSGDNVDSGIALHYAGLVRASTNNAAAPLDLNIKGRDGTIADFRKDGASKGTVGTTTSAGGSRFAIGAVGDPGIIFAGTGVFPATEITASNGVTDLGSGDYRWKDLYLSGGVYLGGTGAANLLDDYEEGTWTPNDNSGAGLTIAVNASSYTKIGRLCYIYAYITYPSNSSTVSQELGGLPFPTKVVNTYAQLTIRIVSDALSTEHVTFQTQTNSSYGRIHYGTTVPENVDLSGVAFLISGVYEVA